MSARRQFPLSRWQCVAGAAVLSLGLFAAFARADETDALIQQLTSTFPNARLAAARKAAQLGPAAAKTAPALIEALKCEQIEVLFPTPDVATSRQQFADALVKIGESITPELEKALEHENGLVRVWTAQALHRIDREQHTDRVIPVLTAALREADEVAGDAALVLESMGADAGPATAALIEQLAHRELVVRCSAAHALAAIARGDDARRLVEALQHEKPIARVGAAFALYRVNAESSEDIQAVIAAALKEESTNVRRQAVWAVGQMGAAALPLAEALIQALPQLDPDPREYFFGGGMLSRQCVDPSMALSAIGPEAKPALLKALEHENQRARVMAAVALLRLDRSAMPQVTPVLKAALEDPDQSVRFLAQMNYAPQTSNSSDVNKLVQAAMQDNGFGPPSPATFQLMRRGAEAIEPLMAVLKSGDGMAARRAASILGSIGAPALPALTEAMKSDDDQLRVFAITAVAAMGEVAVPVLVSALDDEVYPVRRAARYALQSIGTPEAVDALRKLAQ